MRYSLRQSVQDGEKGDGWERRRGGLQEDAGESRDEKREERLRKRGEEGREGGPGNAASACGENCRGNGGKAAGCGRKSETGRYAGRCRWTGTGQEECSCLEEAACVVILLIFSAVLLLLFCLSVTGSAAVYGGSEQIWFYPDSPFLHLFVFAAVTAAGTAALRGPAAASGAGKGAASGEEPFLRAPVSLNRVQFGRWVLIISGIYLIWIMGTMFGAISDQRMVVESGKALIHGDMSPWAPVGFRYNGSGCEGYAYTYPHQNGQILFAALLALISEEHVAFLWQLSNVAFLAAGMIYTGRLAAETLGIRKGYGLTLAMLAFLPFSFYITFVYGTVPGFACASAAVWYEKQFLDRRGWKNLLLSAACITAAILFKSNYLIVLTAMVLIFLADALFRRRAVSLLGAAAVIAAYLFSHGAVNAGLSAAAGHPVDGGPPMLAWVEMGLQEGSRAPGWFNNYNVYIYLDNKEDAEMTEAAVERDLAQTFRYFLEHPDYSAGFFDRKLRSMWTEPTFQSLWIQEMKGRGWLFPSFAGSLFKEGGTANEVYWQLCNAVQSLVYLGALLFVWFRGRRVRLEGLFFAVIFIGGFLFHLFWEAKGQYAAAYFVMLLPYAWTGLGDWILQTGRWMEAKRRRL